MTLSAIISDDLINRIAPSLQLWTVRASMERVGLEPGRKSRVHGLREN